jgi:hypothetical protein
MKRGAADLMVGVLRRQRGVDWDRCPRVIEAKRPFRNGRAAVLARIDRVPRHLGVGPRRQIALLRHREGQKPGERSWITYRQER